MSQEGKVLHLYVEVCSMAKDRGTMSGRGDDNTGHPMLQGPDVFPHSQRTSTHSSPNRSHAHSPVSQHYSGSRNHSLLSSKSVSRHSVSFQLQNPDATGSPTQYHRQDVLPDSFNQLLEVLASGTVSSGDRSSLGRTFSLDVNPNPGKALGSTCSGRNIASPPTHNCRSNEVEEIEDEEGKTSVVSYGYIEKSNVHSMAGHRASLCQNDDSSSSKIEGQLLPHLCKRLSDPVWSKCQYPQGDPLNNHLYTSQNSSLRDLPSMQKEIMDSLARDATSRTPEKFGSTGLKCRFAGFDPECCSYSPTLPRQQQSHRCRSWAGSPVLPRTTRTLPSKTQLLELDRRVGHSSLTRLPRSPASDQLCDHFDHSAHSKASAPHSTCQQRPYVGGDRPRPTSKFHLMLPAGRPTDIQHEVAAGSFPSCKTSFQPGHRISSGNHANFNNFSREVPDGPRYLNGDKYFLSRNTHYKWNPSSVTVSDEKNPTPGNRPIFPSSNPEMACKLVVESKRMANLAERRTPSPTSHIESFMCESSKSAGSLLNGSQPSEILHGQSSLDPKLAGSMGYGCGRGNSTPQTKPGCISPLLSQRGHSAVVPPTLLAPPRHTKSSHCLVLDPRQQSSLSSLNTSSLHRYQLPQYIGELKSPGVERLPKDYASFSQRLVHRNAETSPVSWTSRHEEWLETRQTQNGDHHGLHPLRPVTPHGSENCSEDGGHRAMMTSDSQSRAVSLVMDQREDVLDFGRAARTLSQNSSGVRGSLDDPPQMGRHYGLCPETYPASQSRHKTESSPGTQACLRLQSDGSSITPSHSERIALAKWEFLFGGATQQTRCFSDASSRTPPSSSLPSSSPPSFHLTATSQKGGLDSGGRKLSHHEVQQIEVELLSANTQNTHPKTGIIRRTTKYSETDLDAIPLCCYRETDLDEVMRAEAETADDVDSAFSSNRSFCPANTSSKGPAIRVGVNGEGGVEDEDEEEEKEEEEEEEEEEGVVSWASVRMQGDKQRQRVAQEEAEVLDLLLKGSLDTSSDFHGGIKSPISVGSPRRPSDSNLDSFSRHFESIMESHRAKGTSYSSLDSVDLLTSGSTSIFTFDLPTLTPEIQSQICESAKQIIELSFAPLSRPAPSRTLDTSRSEISLCLRGTGAPGYSDNSGTPNHSRSEREAWRCSPLRHSFRKASSVPVLHCSSRERPVNRPPELISPKADVAERLALGGSDDTLANGTKADLQAAKRLAKRLYSLDGFRKSDVARHLVKNNDFSQMVAEEYLSNFNFTGLTVDQALRLFLRQFALTGETQERERVLVHFSRRFNQCNPDCLQTEDSVHTLTCAVMLLNTDLHGNNVGKRMSCSQFISNLEGLNNGKDFPKELLKTLYNSIKNEKLQWTIDEEELRKSITDLADTRTDSASHTMKRLVGGNPLVGVAQQADAELYKSGFLVRKVHADPDGKRTPRGKRGWKTFYGMLKGLVLYLQKEEYRVDREVTEEDVKNAVSVHHSLAMRAADYSKRPNVFYLRTADWRVFLFQAPNSEQMHSWITRINVVAAMFSAPPFPAAIGSQKRFSRPLLPGSNTKLSQAEQIKSHESRFRAVSSELTELGTASPDRKVKGREQEEHKLRWEYLEFEKTRYGTYAMLLRAKMASGDIDLSAFESRLFDDGGLQRAHSSPVLPQDAATTKEKIRVSKSLKVMTSSSKSDSSKKYSGSQRAELLGPEQKKAGPQRGESQKAEPQKQNNSVNEVP